MERIAKALELARQDAKAAGESPHLREPLNLREPAHQVPVSRISYTRTRPVAVSDEVLRARNITGGQERTPIAEAFKRLRTQVMERMRNVGVGNALGIASPRAGEGKTTVAMNLAVHASMEADWTVLLVDADLRRPGLCEALGIEPLPGLSDYLVHDRPLDELLVHPGFGRCVLLPAGAPLADSSEALGSARMQGLVMELKRRYPDRLVIFDLPPLLDSADGIAALRWVDALLLVVDEGHTAVDDVLRAAQLAGDGRLLGTVLNNSREPQRVQGAAAAAAWWRRTLGGD
jgi:Mrp family chromosome partitioning ATPase